MKSVKVLLSLAVLAFVAILATPLSEAQCVPGRNFASAINGTVKQGFGQVVVTSPGTPLGDEIGRFWQSNNSLLANNFGGLCPAASWWKASAAPLGNAVSGTIGAVGCAASACPDLAQDLTAVVEDWGTAAPGIDGTAYFVAWRVNPTPALLRAWNYARVAAASGTGSTTYPFLEFPSAFVTGSNRTGMNVDVTMNYADVAPNFHGANGGGAGAGDIGVPLPADGTIVSYDLMLFVGLTDPGRARSAWTEIATIDYPGAGVPAQFHSINCPDVVNDAFLAVGIAFDSGNPLSPIDSTLVGRATRIECNPNLADPQQQPTQRLQQKQETRRPAGRR